MEDLTKTQLVLLTLLVSFVTSIGTGIITVSLLNEAPQTVTQTINRVVERTVEKVVPGDQGIVEKETVTREVTVVVKEEDLVIDAIRANSQSLVRIRKDNAEALYGIGVIISQDGWIVAGDNATARGLYKVTLANGQEYDAEMIEHNNDLGLTFLKIEKELADATVFTSAPRGNSNSLQLGQTVIDLGGSQKDVVSIGRITSLDYLEGSEEESSSIVSNIETDIVPKNVELGSVLISLSGEAVGFKLGAPSATTATYIPLNLILQRFAVVQSNESN